jgi:hypothetical protein
MMFLWNAIHKGFPDRTNNIVIPPAPLRSGNSVRILYIGVDRRSSAVALQFVAVLY